MCIYIHIYIYIVYICPGVQRPLPPPQGMVIPPGMVIPTPPCGLWGGVWACGGEMPPSPSLWIVEWDV